MTFHSLPCLRRPLMKTSCSCLDQRPGAPKGIAVHTGQPNAGRNAQPGDSGKFCHSATCLYRQPHRSQQQQAGACTPTPTPAARTSVFTRTGRHNTEIGANLGRDERKQVVATWQVGKPPQSSENCHDEDLAGWAAMCRAQQLAPCTRVFNTRGRKETEPELDERGERGREGVDGRCGGWFEETLAHVRDAASSDTSQQPVTRGSSTFPSSRCV